MANGGIGLPPRIHQRRHLIQMSRVPRIWPNCLKDIESKRTSTISHNPKHQIGRAQSAKNCYHPTIVSKLVNYSQIPHGFNQNINIFESCPAPVSPKHSFRVRQIGQNIASPTHAKKTHQFGFHRRAMVVSPPPEARDLFMMEALILQQGRNTSWE
jgi:hypothetical protein